MKSANCFPVRKPSELAQRMIRRKSPQVINRLNWKCSEQILGVMGFINSRFTSTPSMGSVF